MKRGISLVSLMITLTIMIAIISTVTISGLNTLNNNKKITFATEINMVQNAVDTYKTKNNGEYPINGTVQLDVSKVTDRAKQQFSDETYLSNNLIELYKIDYSALGITSLRYGASSDGDTDIYVVSKNTGKVYYAKGLSVSNNTYYTLTDDLSRVIKASDEGEVYDGILFSVSNSDWTLDKVVTKVRVPTSYTNVTVGILGKTNIYNFVNDGGYNVFTIDDMLSNYVVTVNYTKNGVANTSEYTVDNVDNIPPDFSKDNVKEGYSEENGSVNAFLLLDGYSDTLSGIKEVKFAYSYIEKNIISSYFKSNGYKVYNNVIELEEAEKYITIYIEDNVGNFSALYYEISDEMYEKLKVLEDIPKNEELSNIHIMSNPSKYYGKKVNFEDGKSFNNWKIFYADENNIYLIAGRCVPNNLLGNIGLSVAGDDSLYSTISREDLLSKISNEGNFNGFKDISGKAQSVVGAPTIEQFIVSYNALNHASISKIYISGDNTIGYKLGKSQDNMDYNLTDLDITESLYISKGNSSLGYWIASTSSSSQCLFDVHSQGIIYSTEYQTSDIGLRPVVCLNSNVKLVKNNDGDYDIK